MKEEDQRLTKKEKRLVKQQSKKEKKQRELWQRALKRYATRTFLIMAVIAAVLGLWKLNQNSSPQVDSASTQNILEVSDSDWKKGNQESKVVLIEYLDFQCPACGYYYDIIKNLEQEYSDRILFVVRHLPLAQQHKNAMSAARASEAAGRQGKFWEMHDSLFENQNEWSNLPNPFQVFSSYAQDIGLDTQKFVKDYEDSLLDEKINYHKSSALRMGVNSTPTFFLNGEEIKNPKSLEEFKSLIENKL